MLSENDHRAKRTGNGRRLLQSAATALAVTMIIAAAVMTGNWFEVRHSRLDRALLEAVKARNSNEVGSLLAQGANPNARVESGKPYPWWTHFLGLFHRAKPLLDVSPTALGISAHTLDLATAKHLIDHGADVNAAGEEGKSPLAIAIREGPSPDQIQQDRLALPRLHAYLAMLLSHGSDPNAEIYPNSQLPDKSFPIDQAAFDGDDETIRMLVAHGVKLNGKRLLWDAITSHHMGSALLLVQSGANVNSAIEGGFTPLMNMADADDDANDPSFAPLMRALLSKGALVNAVDLCGETPLRHAVDRRNRKAADMLRKAGGRLKVAVTTPPCVEERIDL